MPTIAATIGPAGRRRASTACAVLSTRPISRKERFASWDEPASACLSSRIPYGQEVTDERLRQIERAEQVLRDLGFRIFRVRHHDTVARLEIAKPEMPRALDPD